MTQNGALLKVVAFRIRYLNEAEELVVADDWGGSGGVIWFKKGIKTVKVVSIQNLMCFEPLTELPV